MVFDIIQSLFTARCARKSQAFACGLHAMSFLGQVSTPGLFKCRVQFRFQVERFSGEQMLLMTEDLLCREAVQY